MGLGGDAKIVVMLRRRQTVNLRVAGAGATVVASALSFFVMVCVPTWAQEGPVPLDEEIEEIVVLGEKSLPILRQAVYRAEEDFFRLFSELNENDEFDTNCFRERPTYSLIPRHVCRANFVTQAETDEAVAWFLGRAEVPAHTAIAVKRKRMLEEMERTVSERPELYEALVKYVEANEAYQDERKKRCEGRILVCR